MDNAGLHRSGRFGSDLRTRKIDPKATFRFHHLEKREKAVFGWVLSCLKFGSVSVENSALGARPRVRIEDER